MPLHVDARTTLPERHCVIPSFSGEQPNDCSRRHASPGFAMLSSQRTPAPEDVHPAGPRQLCTTFVVPHEVATSDFLSSPHDAGPGLQAGVAEAAGPLPSGAPASFVLGAGAAAVGVAALFCSCTHAAVASIAIASQRRIDPRYTGQRVTVARACRSDRRRAQRRTRPL